MLGYSKVRRSSMLQYTELIEPRKVRVTPMGLEIYFLTNFKKDIWGGGWRIIGQEV